MRFDSIAFVIAQVMLVIGILSCEVPEPKSVSLKPDVTNPASTVTIQIKELPTDKVPTAIPTAKATPPIWQFPTGTHGGTLTIANSADVHNLDIHQSHQQTLSELGPGLAYSRLLRLQTGPLISLPSLLLECDLCESWKINSDLSYEFQLRSSTHWQNIYPVNGRRLVASDLVYSYDRLETETWPYATLFKDRGISRFIVDGPSILKIERAFLDSDILLSLADGHSKIVASEVIQEYGDLKESPVIGTGPWLWNAAKLGNAATLSRNPNYFEEGFPYLDNLIIKTIKPTFTPYPDRRRQISAFATGLVDVVALTPTDWGTLQSSATEFNSYKSESNQARLLVWFNTRTQVGGNKQVRQAIFRSLDPWESLYSTWNNLGSVSLGIPVSSSDWLLTKKQMRSQYFANPSEARSLVADHTTKTSFNINIAMSDSNKAVLNYSQSLAENLQAIGFNPKLRAVNTSHYVDLMGNKENPFDLMIGEVPTIPSTNGFLFSLIHSKGPTNLLGHQDNILDQLIEAQAAEETYGIRRDQIWELQEYLLEEAYFFSPVSNNKGWAFIWSLQNFYPNTALSEYIFWSKTWLKP